MKKWCPQSLFSAEMELVLESIRGGEADAERIKGLLRQKLDWPVLCEMAVREGVLPLLFARLKELGRDLVRVAEMASIRSLFLANSGRNLLLAHRLTQLLDLLSHHGVEVVSFKGPVLALQAYGNLSLRSFEDLDILIRRDDFPRTYDVLTQAGFEARTTDDNFNARLSTNKKMQKWLAQYQPELNFFGKGVNVDLHWAFSWPWASVATPPERLWQQLQTIVLNDKKVSTLSLENTFELLWTHGKRHQWKGLQNIADIAHLARVYPDRARHILSGRTHVIPRRELDEFRLVINDPSAFARSVLANRSRFNLAKRIHTFVRGSFIPNPPDWVAVELPNQLYPLYYILRPGRLCWKYARKLVRSMLGRAP